MADQSVTPKGETKRLFILSAAREAFLVGGFQATSMQDLFKATGQSPGGFYRYFPSKEALIHALAAETIGRLAATVIATMNRNPVSVADALLPAVQTIDAMERRDGTSRLALMIWSESQRSAEMAILIGEAIRPLLQALADLATALRAHGIVDERYQAREVAVMLGGILQGYVVQRAMFGIDPVTYELGLRAISGYHTA